MEHGKWCHSADVDISIVHMLNFLDVLKETQIIIQDKVAGKCICFNRVTPPSTPQLPIPLQLLSIRTLKFILFYKKSIINSQPLFNHFTCLFLLSSLFPSARQSIVCACACSNNVPHTRCYANLAPPPYNYTSKIFPNPRLYHTYLLPFLVIV